MGLSDKKKRNIPTGIPNLKHIISVSCGGFRTICHTNKGQVYIWGWNNSGQLGLGDDEDRIIPTLIPSFSYPFLSSFYTFMVNNIASSVDDISEIEQLEKENKINYVVAGEIKSYMTNPVEKIKEWEKEQIEREERENKNEL